MATTVRFKPKSRQLTVTVSKSLSPETRRKMIADVARKGLREAQDVNKRALGQVPPHETFVNGSRNNNLEAVNPDRGSIAFIFEFLTDLFSWIDLQLIKHAPVRSGRYRRSFKLFADGTEIDPDGQIPKAGEYVYLNVQPYSRKIERGLSKQAPDGVFQAVAALAGKRFHNMAQIRFSYRTPITAVRGTVRGKRAADKASRQPAIVIVLR